MRILLDYSLEHDVTEYDRILCYIKTKHILVSLGEHNFLIVLKFTEFFFIIDSEYSSSVNTEAR